MLSVDWAVEFNGINSEDYNNDGVYGWLFYQNNVFGLPTPRFQSFSRTSSHGSFPSNNFYYSNRTVTFSGEVWAFSDSDLAAVNNAFMTMTTQTQTGYQFKIRLPGYGVLVLDDARIVNRSWQANQQNFITSNKAEIAFQVSSPDPRWYSETETEATSTLSTAGSGLSFPLTYPLSYGGGASGGVVLTNNGTFNTEPTAVVTGPLTTFGLENVTTGEHLQFNNGPSAGQNLYISFHNRTVRLDDPDTGANRYSWIQDSSQWWDCPPGDSSVRLTGSSAGSPQCVFSIRDAYV